MTQHAIAVRGIKSMDELATTLRIFAGTVLGGFFGIVLILSSIPN